MSILKKAYELKYVLKVLIVNYMVHIFDVIVSFFLFERKSYFELVRYKARIRS
jgi:hypothetical protein